MLEPQKDETSKIYPRRKQKKLLLLSGLAVLLGLAALILYFQNQRTPQQKPVFTADSLAVAGIQITDQDGSITIEKSGRVWNITSPVNWVVEPGRFSLFFRDVVLSRYETTPRGSGEDALAQYRLDGSKVLKVKVWGAKNKLLGEAWFADLNANSDCFRFAGKEDVFKIQSRVASMYAPRFETWRSPQVLRLFGDQMLTIKVQHPKNSYELTRTGNVWRFTDKLEDFDIPAGNQTMGKLLNILTQLGSYSILSGKTAPPADSIGASVCQVEILKTDNSRIVVDFLSYGKQYLMTVDTHPDLYFVVLFDTIFRFTRHAALFRAKEGYPG